MMEFLYFPEDSSEYLPSLLALIVFSIAAILITRIFINVSKKEQRNFEDKYAEKIGKHDKNNS
jgi:hypothetical protein